MKIDQTHRPVAFAVLTVFAAATLFYAFYAATYPGGPRGNTIPGLVYGILGYALILFAGLLGVRKRLRLWRVGKAQAWMRGHLWFGALSLALIAFHAGFVARGPLTMLLTALLFLVVGSGILGAALQHIVPGILLSRVELETVYEQIPHVREKLREEANAIIDKLCMRQEEVVAAAGKGSARFIPAVAEDEEVAQLSDDEIDNLHGVFVNSILPFLRDPENGASRLARPGSAAPFFEALRCQLPEHVHGSVRALEEICEEERQLTRQRRLYFWLHGWQLIHVPLSVSLVVLGLIHAFTAIRY